MIDEMDRRRAATQKTIDRFKGKAFDWKANATCAHLLRFHMRNMGRKCYTVPRFRSAATAKAAIMGMGFGSMSEVMDSMADRLPSPAFLKMGDIITVDGTDNMDAIFICVGRRSFFGWFEGHDKTVIADIDFSAIKGAWHG